MAEPNFEDILGLNDLKENLQNSARNLRMNKGIGCALCDYFGYTTNYKGKSVMCSCEKEKFLRELYVKANVPRVYIGKSLDDWNIRADAHGRDLGQESKTSERVLLLLKYFEKFLIDIVNNDPPNIRHTGNIRTPLTSIIFDGKNGSGKTFIGAVLVQSAIKKGLSSKYYDWTEIISILSDFDKKDDIIPIYIYETDDSEEDETDKNTKSSEAMKKMTKMNMEIIANAIESISLPAEMVTSREFITEYLERCDRNAYEAIRSHVVKLRENSAIKPQKIKCVNCEHEYSQELALNVSDFFA